MLPSAYVSREVLTLLHIMRERTLQPIRDAQHPLQVSSIGTAIENAAKLNPLDILQDWQRLSPPTRVAVVLYWTDDIDLVQDPELRKIIKDLENRPGGMLAFS